MRRLVLLSLMSWCLNLAVAACAVPVQAPKADGTIEPAVRMHSRAYDLERRDFQTNLIRKGPAPEVVPMPATPPDAEEFAYGAGPLRLRAWIGQPSKPAAPRRPVVIFLHGGSGLGLDAWKIAQSFRDAGFLTVTPALRGENGQPGDFSLFYEEVDDVLALTEALLRRPDVDPQRIYLSGHSAGGTLALLTAMASKHFRAVTSFSASPDQAIFVRYGLDPKAVPFNVADDREIEMRSPLSFAPSFSVPARLYFGTREPHFRLSTLRLADVAKSSGHDVQAVEVEGDHFSAVSESVSRAIDFFRAR